MGQQTVKIYHLHTLKQKWKRLFPSTLPSFVSSSSSSSSSSVNFNTTTTTTSTNHTTNENNVAQVMDMDPFDYYISNWLKTHHVPFVHGRNHSNLELMETGLGLMGYQSLVTYLHTHLALPLSWFIPPSPELVVIDDTSFLEPCTYYFPTYEAFLDHSRLEKYQNKKCIQKQKRLQSLASAHHLFDLVIQQFCSMQSQFTSVMESSQFHPLPTFTTATTLTQTCNSPLFTTLTSTGSSFRNTESSVDSSSSSSSSSSCSSSSLLHSTSTTHSNATTSSPFFSLSLPPLSFPSSISSTSSSSLSTSSPWIVCIDVEAYEWDHRYLTELGIAIFTGTHIEVYHGLIKETLPFINGVRVPNARDHFLVPNATVIHPFHTWMQWLDQLASQAKLIVGHALPSDLQLLKKGRAWSTATSSFSSSSSCLSKTMLRKPSPTTTKKKASHSTKSTMPTTTLSPHARPPSNVKMKQHHEPTSSSSSSSSFLNSVSNGSLSTPHPHPSSTSTSMPMHVTMHPPLSPSTTPSFSLPFSSFTTTSQPSPPPPLPSTTTSTSTPSTSSSSNSLPMFPGTALCVDTQVLFKAWTGNVDCLRLSKLLDYFEFHYHPMHLHNAGNDAYFTLLVFLKMVFEKHPPFKQTWKTQVQELPVLFPKPF